MHTSKEFLDLLDKYQGKKWEILFFVSPVCNSSCSHCWSYNTYLGKMVGLQWYEQFFSKLPVNSVKEIKLTGGETTMYPYLRELVSLIRKYMPIRIPITIFTNGRNFVPLKYSAPTSVDTTIQNIKKIISDNQNISIQMSADEHHAGSLYRAIQKRKTPSILKKDIMQDNLSGEPYLKDMVYNFLEAIKYFDQKEPNLCFHGKLKMHCETGRLEYHRKTLYEDMSQEDWDKYVIGTEGLIYAGNAKNLEHSIKIEQNDDFISAFVFPGAKFTTESQRVCEQYKTPNGDELYLVGSQENDSGIVMLGWWNIIEKRHCAGTTNEFLSHLR